MLWVGCLPCLSVTVYCGETAGLIKMPLGTEVDLGLGDIVSSHRKGTAPSQFLANVYFGQMVAHLSYC